MRIENYQIFSSLRSECKMFIKNSHGNYCRKIENNLCNNPRFFWKHVRSQKTDNDISQSMSQGDDTYLSQSDSVDAFADYFSSVFTEPVLLNSGHHLNLDNVCDLNDVELTREKIFDGLNKLEFDQSPGPDGILNSFLTNCATSLTIPLYHIFNKSLLTGIFLSIWKQSKVISNFKNGNKILISNYRPISILSA